MKTLHLEPSRFFSTLLTILIALFFLSILIFPGSYNYIPALLILFAFSYFMNNIFRSRDRIRLDCDQKLLFLSYGFYFLLFVISFWINQGKLRQLDNPSRIIFFLPILFLLIDFRFNFKVLLYAIPLGALSAGLVAIYQRIYLGNPMAFTHIMHIQGGDISMSLGLFSVCTGIYWYQIKNNNMVAFSFICALFGILGSILSTARGGWVGVPFIILLILYVHRKSLSRRFFMTTLSVVILAVSSTVVFNQQTRILERLDSAYSEVVNYFEQNNGSTSVGARFDMWKSALIAIEDKPILGWGIDGITELRKQQSEQGIISEYAGGFNHAHNQFLDDASKRGLLGLGALMAIFFVPLSFFSRTLHHANGNLALRYVALMGIVHVLSVMSYGLSQAFFAHNSGNTFYFFLIIVLYAAINNIRNEKVR
jgi:O-antigen ligase